ncbi:MAG: rhodanese-like domain-containing protein [Chitinophagaceae bacterium]
MKNAWFILLLFMATSCQAQQDSSRKIGPDKFEKGIARPGIQILDVRTPGEYNNGHIKNSMLADWTNREQFNDRIQYVDINIPVYIYCQVGGRSTAAANWMRQNGFSEVLELNGGFNEWKKERKPIEGISNEPQMTLEQYQALIPKDKTTLVDFGAKWCPPCVKMAPVIKDLEDNKDLDFLLVNIDAGLHLDVTKALNIEPIPVFIIYKNGMEVWRRQGLVSKEELLAQLK